jgi:Protein of unknown function (DUF1573)
VLFDLDLLDFGEMKEGEVLSIQYSFLNIGSDSLEIEVVSACDCMEVDWARSPIAPKERGAIEILYDTTKRLGETLKDIDIIFKNTDKNGYPLVKRVVLKGMVI